MNARLATYPTSIALRILVMWILVVWISDVCHAHRGIELRLDELDGLIKIQPHRQELYILRGAEYSRHGQWDLALHDFERAGKLGNDDAVAFELGRHYYRRGNYEAARLRFTQYRFHRPGNIDVLVHRARTSVKLGDLDAALGDYTQYFDLKLKAHPGDYLSAAKLLTSHRAGGIEQALALLDRGLNRLGVGPQLQRYAVELELRRGQSDLALKRWLLLESSLGHSPAWKIELAELYITAIRYGDAEVWLDNAEQQLRTMTQTPARWEMRKTIAKLRNTIDNRRKNELT